jgi:hypothetical protein
MQMEKHYKMDGIVKLIHHSTFHLILKNGSCTHTKRWWVGQDHGVTSHAYTEGDWEMRIG